MNCKSVIIIEDDECMRSMICRFYKDQGWTTVECKLAEEYLTNYKDNKFDLAIVDIILPGMNGIELVKKHFKKDQKTIVISGHISSQLGKELFNDKNIIFLEKPFYFDNLKYFTNKLVDAFENNL